MNANEQHIPQGFALVATAVLEALIQAHMDIAADAPPVQPHFSQFASAGEFGIVFGKWLAAQRARQALQFANLAADEPAADGDDDEAPTAALERGAQS